MQEVCLANRKSGGGRLVAKPYARQYNMLLMRRLGLGGVEARCFDVFVETSQLLVVADHSEHVAREDTRIF